MTMLYGCLAALGLVVAGIVLYARQIRNRPKIRYPDPESMIIQPDNTIPVSTPRILSFEGVANFRDLGGYRTYDGKTVKWRTVFRSGKWSQPSESDIAKMKTLGIRLVCDLRSDDEVKQHPNRLTDGIHYLHLPINDDVSTWERLVSLVWNRGRLPQQMQDVYNHLFLDNNPTVFGDVLRYLAQAENLPALIHCNAGKDRSGLASALLLLILGIPEETVIAEYTLSNYEHAYFREITAPRIAKLSFLNINIDDLYPLITASATIMRGAIDHLKSTYGSVEGYLTDVAGLDSDTIQHLRENLLE